MAQVCSHRGGWREEPVIKIDGVNAWLVYPAANITWWCPHTSLQSLASYPRLLWIVKINEQFSNKAKEFINGGKTTAGTRVNEDTAQQASLPLCPRLQLLYEKVLVHEQVSDTSVRRLRHQEEAVWKQLYLSQWTESMKDTLYLGLETTKFFKTFSFSLGKTNKSSSFHLQEDSWGMTELNRCQDDPENLWGFLSGPRSENYWILATSLSAEATIQIAQKYPRIKGVKRWDIY